MEFDPKTTVCVTGHRPQRLGGYGQFNPTMLAVSRDLNRKVVDLVDQGYRTFISGMALGVDQLFARIVLNKRTASPTLGLRLVAAVPFYGQESVWTKDQRTDYAQLLALADCVEYVCSPGYASWKMQRRNEWMVDRSSALVVVWDGAQSGGTYNCVRYAQMRQINILRVDVSKESIQC